MTNRTSTVSWQERVGCTCPQSVGPDFDCPRQDECMAAWHAEQQSAVTQEGLWQLAQVLVCMALDDELESLEVTLDENNQTEAVAALRAVRKKVADDINAYTGDDQ